MKTLLKNGTVIDYATNTCEKLDVLIENEKIVKIEKEIKESAEKEIDCSMLYIMPGMVDMHCHLREPGGEHKETIETGSKSAVAGGFTTIFKCNKRRKRARIGKFSRTATSGGNSIFR